MKRILVIGATGNVGRQVISQLITANVRVRALTRNPDSAGLPAQVEIVQGDLTIPTTLDRPLDDVDAVFLYYLVAHALAHGDVLVTHEIASTSTKKIKIPDACIGLGIKCVTPFEMLRLERARFVLGTKK